MPQSQRAPGTEPGIGTDNLSLSKQATETALTGTACPAPTPSDLCAPPELSAFPAGTVWTANFIWWPNKHSSKPMWPIPQQQSKHVALILWLGGLPGVGPPRHFGVSRFRAWVWC